MIGWLLAGAAGLTAAMLVDMSLGWVQERRQHARRLQQGAGEPAPRPPGGERLLLLGGLIRRVIPPGWVSFIRRRIGAAGLRSTIEQFLGIWTLLLITWYLLFSALALTFQIPGWLYVGIILFSLLVPFLHLSAQETERYRRIRREFPFLIDFVTMAVEAGVSLDSALVRASQRLRGPIGDELQRYVTGINRGMTRREALLGFAEGLSLPEVRDFVHALIQSTGFGLPLAEVLRRQAEQFREVRRVQAEEAAQKIPIKLLLPLVLFIFPTIFLFVLGPAVIWLLYNGL